MVYVLWLNAWSGSPLHDGLPDGRSRRSLHLLILSCADMVLSLRSDYYAVCFYVLYHVIMSCVVMSRVLSVML